MQRNVEQIEYRGRDYIEGRESEPVEEEVSESTDNTGNQGVIEERGEIVDTVRVPLREENGINIEIDFTA